MTSINTNIAAQTALRTLQSTNAQLDQTQSRISTGLKIAEAKDNAAYWSISTTLRSDNKALGTVKDAMSMGSGTIDTAYRALNESRLVLDEIKSKLQAATAGSADRSKIMSEIKQLQAQLENIASIASFSGQNWLSVDSSQGDFANGIRSITTGFTRAESGQITLTEIDVDIKTLALIDTNANGQGILDRAGFGDAAAPINTLRDVIGRASATDGAAAAAGTTAFAVAAGGVIRDGEVLAFDLTVNGTTRNVAIDFDLMASVARAGQLADTDPASGYTFTAAEFENVLNAAFTAAGFAAGEVTADLDTGVMTLTGPTATNGGKLRIANAQSYLHGTGSNVLNFDIEGMSDGQLVNMLSTVNVALDNVVTAASDLGAIAKRIDLQQSFVSNLMDTIDKGISGLVDADMNEESTRLQALQVKQQLGVQALSIANQSAQNVLRLFQ